MDIAKVTLVTLIAAFELEDRLVADLRSLGVNAYTVGRVGGRGEHGTRIPGLADAPNLRIEMLVHRDLSRNILRAVATSYVDQPVIAYVQEVEAVPAAHFA